MPDKRDLDQADRPDDTPLDEDEEVVGIGEDEDEFEDDEEDADELDEEPHSMAPTDEVGSEGGSEGHAVHQGRSRVGRTAGTEATETWRPSHGERSTVERRDSTGLPFRRSPS